MRRWPALLLVLSALCGLPLEARADCPIRRVRGPGDALGAELGGVWLQNSTLVERLPAPDCETGVGLRVRSDPALYADGHALLGRTLCVRMEEPALRTVVGDRLLRPGDSQPVGPIDAACHLPGRQDLRDLDLSHAVPLRPAAAATWRQLRRRLQALYGADLGGVDPTRIRVDDWGRAELPMAALRGPDELALEYAREGLDTEARRQRAVTAWGPRLSGQPVYAHFLGADPAGADLWAQPDVILSLLQLSHDWMAWCPSALHRPAERCTLQIGDLAWFNSQRPDPLGHKDHWAGRCVDLRLFRSDGSRYEAWWNRPDDRPGVAPAYDAALTAAFVGFVRARFAVGDLFFNDPAVPGVEPQPGHDDHLHLCLRAGGSRSSP